MPPSPDSLRRALAERVVVADGANLGLGTSVHQRRYIGRGAMIGMGSVVTRDVPPWAKVFGNPARIHGANAIGMERAGIAADAAASLGEIYSAPFDPTRLKELEATDIAEAVAEWRSATAS